MNLNDRFKKFADSEYESIDDIQDIKFIVRKADYFAFERSWILEVKFLEKDRQSTINDFTNDQVDKDQDFPEFFGTVHIEELIQKHKDPNFIRNKLCDYASRNLRSLLSSADKQISETKKAIGKDDCTGILVLLNERNDFHDQDFIYQEISRLLHRKDEQGNIQRKHIQGVWYIHEYKENNKRNVFSSFLMGPTANIESVKSLGNFLHMDWISYNGYAFIPSDLK